MNNLGLGFFLMLIGMVTVFLILVILIYGSRLIISLINRIAPEEAPQPRKTDAGAQGPDMRVLEAAVSQITGGAGRIVKVTEI